LIFAFAKINQNKKRIARRSERNTLCAQSALMEKTNHSVGLSFLFGLIDSRVGYRESKGCFEPAGSTRFHLDGLKGLVP